MNPFHLSSSSSSVAVAGVVVPVLPCGLARCRGMLRPDDLIASGPILRPSRPARLGFRPPFFVFSASSSAAAVGVLAVVVVVVPPVSVLTRAAVAFLAAAPQVDP